MSRPAEEDLWWRSGFHRIDAKYDNLPHPSELDDWLGVARAVDSVPMPASVAASIATLDRLAEEMRPASALLSRLRADDELDLATRVFGLEQPTRQRRLRSALATA